MSIHWPRFVELVRSHDRFLLTSHVRPDCDALGSELGMAGILEALHKSVVIVNAQRSRMFAQCVHHMAYVVKQCGHYH